MNEAKAANQEQLYCLYAMGLTTKLFPFSPHPNPPEGEGGAKTKLLLFNMEKTNGQNLYRYTLPSLSGEGPGMR